MKHASLLAVVILLAACSPQVYPLYMDVRQPSSSGLDLNRKSMSIVYMDGTHELDSLFDRSTASALARCLEEDYFNGEEVVGIYHIPSPDTVTVETMHSLVMDTEKDVIFLLSTQMDVPSDTTGSLNIPISARLFVYDSMGEDKVHNYRGSSRLVMDSLSELGTSAEEIAKRISSRFLSGWQTESFRFYYFDSLVDDAWLTALQKVDEGALAKAIDLWMPLVQRGSVIKQACASYNIAMAFYLLEDYEMSDRWLSVAEKWENLSLAPGLRKRLSPHLEKTQ